MEITGKIYQLLPRESFKTRGGEDFLRGGFVIETVGEHSHKLKFDVYGEERLGIVDGLAVGSDVNVFFDASSREWNGKWYSSLTCWRVVALGQSALPQSSQVSQPQPSVSAPKSAAAAPQNSDGEGALPF